MTTETIQALFNHILDQHDLILLESEMFEIEAIIKPEYLELIEASFVAGRSQTSWEQFKKDNNL